nr:MAG TPA: hypothetical protein [Caudoviricetes sp.]DAR77956.1 MAG TPA: hypothetical protein [Caudoviricetes sp.]DAX35985.1 MAG TPA: hypothetical protein [Caudoviricetes sp.]
MRLQRPPDRRQLKCVSRTRKTSILSWLRPLQVTVLHRLA